MQTTNRNGRKFCFTLVQIFTIRCLATRVNSSNAANEMKNVWCMLLGVSRVFLDQFMACFASSLRITVYVSGP